MQHDPRPAFDSDDTPLAELPEEAERTSIPVRPEPSDDESHSSEKIPT